MRMLIVLPLLLLVIAPTLDQMRDQTSPILGDQAVPARIQQTGRTATSASEAVGQIAAVRSVEAFHPVSVSLGNANQYTPPDFSKIRSGKARKQAFYDYLLPMVHKANEEVALERRWLISIAESLVEGRSLTDETLNDLALMEKRYSLQQADAPLVSRIAELLQRVDVVPAALVMAQAAKESGWGTSRFAREGNNYFGIWCFYRGCGMTPLRREKGRAHEVATFASVEQGVRYYVRTINTHAAYTELRAMRADSRRAQRFMAAEELANGLERYSERGMAYVRELQTMIRYNQMQRFDRNYAV